MKERKTQMKKIVLIAIAILILAIPFLSYAETSNLYAKSGRIVELDEEHDIVTFVDCNGFLWCFYGVEDWNVGDWCAVIFDTMGTDTIFDDEIISVRYENWN